jgi:chromosome segregation ATPase
MLGSLIFLRAKSMNEEKEILSAFAAVNKGLRPIKDDLTTIKGQLDQISTAVEDLSRRIEEIENLLKTQEAKKQKLKAT